MGWSKQDLIKRAFGKIGLAPSVFDLSAEQLQDALQDLDAMMAAWNARGIRLGYPLPSTAGGSLPADDSGLPDAANEAVVANLALRLAEDLGKAVSPRLALIAKQGYDTLLARAALPPQMKMPSGMPAGAGQERGSGRPFLDPPDDDLEAGPDGVLEFK
ncbi:MAG: packaged DNA stabilization gp4 family protein [Elusimicrobiota bacterium]|jgi:hypothetical protein